MIYICILLQMLESRVSLLITTKPTTQENFRLAAILLYRWHTGVGRFSKKNYLVDIQLEMDLFVQK